MRIAVTGLGATSPLGGDVASNWSALIEGRSGIKTLTEPWVDEMTVHFAGVLAEEPPLDRVEARKLDRSQQVALVAAREAWADAGSPEVDPLRMGTVIGSGIGGFLTLLNAYDTLKERGPSRISPHTVPMLMPSGPAAAVGLEFHAAAGVHAPVSACASGAEAIGVAARMIVDGRADVVLAGGTETPIHQLTMAGFAAMRALSTRNDDPQGASRPYDVGRDGFVMGEGAAALVLEEYEHARRRGAPILCEVLGYGSTDDAFHITAPNEDADGPSRAMAGALKDGGIPADKVGYINAHGTSTFLNDKIETAAIKRVFGDHARKLCVSSTKSMVGHLLGASGAIELAACAMTLRDRKVHPTINQETPDPELDLDYVPNVARDLSVDYVLSNSLGFGGHNTSLLLGRV